MSQEQELEEDGWFLEVFKGNSPADEHVIRQVEAEAGIRLPDDYKRFLLEMDGGEGFVGHTFIAVWRAGELLEFNRTCGASEFVPELFLFEVMAAVRPLHSINAQLPGQSSRSHLSL
jgi:hypothetical protein